MIERILLWPVLVIVWLCIHGHILVTFIPTAVTLLWMDLRARRRRSIDRDLSD